MFDAVVTPTILYGMETCPLTNHDVEKLEVLQRNLLRKMVGWQVRNDMSWQEHRSQYEAPLAAAMLCYRVATWSDQLAA